VSREFHRSHYLPYGGRAAAQGSIQLGQPVALTNGFLGAAAIAIATVSNTQPGVRHATCVPRTWWLDHAHPVAFSLAGHPGVAVASDRLRDRLPERGVSAVLAHEYASLRALRCPRSPCCPALSAAERCNLLDAAGGGGGRRAGLVVAAATTPADDDRHQERSHGEHR